MSILRLPAQIRCCLYFQGSPSLALSRHASTAFHPANQDEPLPAISEPFPDAFVFTSAALNSYTVSTPPVSQQLQYAHKFFSAFAPKILYSAASFRSFPASPFPEVAFLGRSNVGKSSLLNALFGRTNVKDAHVSKRPGRTRTMNGFGVTGGLKMGPAPAKGENSAAWRQFPRGGLVVVDMPGYGAGSREVWGKETLKYLEERKQLRRTFVLIDAAHGLKKSDITVLTHLRRKGISHQIVLSKVDKVLLKLNKVPSVPRLRTKLEDLQATCRKIRLKLDAEADDGRQGVADILCCSAEKTLERSSHRRIGIDEVRWAALSACGMESDALGQRRMQDIDVLDNDV